MRRPGLALARSLAALGPHNEALAVLDGALDRWLPGDPVIRADSVRERSVIAATSEPCPIGAAPA